MFEGIENRYVKSKLLGNSKKNVVNFSKEKDVDDNNTILLTKFTGLFINNYINDINYLKKEKNILLNINKYIQNLNFKDENLILSNKENNIAIILIGQIRTFTQKEVYLSIKENIIDILEKNNIKYRMFLYVENKKTYPIRVKKKHKVTEVDYIDKNEIIQCINKITDKYILQFYKNKDIIDNIPVLSKTPLTFQNYIFNKAYEMVIKYEKDNNILFNYILKSRPDIQIRYSIDKIIDFKKNNNFFIHEHDFLYIFPRYLAKSITSSKYIFFNPRFDDLCFNLILSITRKYMDRVSNNNINFNMNYPLLETLILPNEHEINNYKDLLNINDTYLNKYIQLFKKLKKLNFEKKTYGSLYVDLLFNFNIDRPLYFFNAHWTFIFIMIVNNIKVLHPTKKIAGLTR